MDAWHQAKQQEMLADVAKFLRSLKPPARPWHDEELLRFCVDAMRAEARERPCAAVFASRLERAALQRTAQAEDAGFWRPLGAVSPSSTRGGGRVN